MSFAVGISQQERSLYYVEGLGSVTITEVALGEQPLRAAGAGLLVSTQRPAIRSLQS